MGYEEIPGAKSVDFRDLSAGWFPGKDSNDIPGSLTNKDDPLGMTDGNAVVWLSGKLQKFFGYDNVNTSALNSGAEITSLFPSEVLGEFVATAGDKLFKDVDSATPTDITGLVTITAGLQMDWTEWQFETDKFIIGANGTDSLIKWTGTGDAAVLGGTPPVGRWAKVWQNALWIARTSTEPSTVFFSDLADPESYTVNNDYKFDAPITGMGILGEKLVVFKANSIGIMSGTRNELLTKVDKYIDGVGCSGGHTIVPAKIRGRDVLIFHSHNGLWAFDGSRNLLDLSNPIRDKYLENTGVNKWNTARFEFAWGTYVPKYKWYFIGLSDSGDTTNDFVMILDLDRVQETREGSYVPHWPIDAIPANCIAGSKTVLTTTDEIYFGDTTGFVYKFDTGIFNNDGVAYDGFFKSKIFDNISTWILGEVNFRADETGTTLTANVNADLETGDGQEGTLSLADTGALLGTTFILGTSVLGGKDFVFEDAAIENFGRFLQFRFGNADLDKGYKIEQINFIIQEIGLDPNAQQE